jgi:hypothetical protein
MLCIHQRLEKKWKYSASAVYRFQDFSHEEVLRNILTDFGIAVELVGQMKIYLNQNL